MVKKRLAWIVGAGALALLLLLAVLSVNLPRLVEKSIEHLVARALPDQPFSCTVRRVGISGAELEAIVLGSPENPGLRIDSLQLNYSLRALFSRHVESLSVDGVLVQGKWQDGRFVLEGFSKKEGAAKQSGGSDFSLPGTIGQLGITGGLLRYGVRGRMENLPFSLHLGQENRKDRGDVSTPLAGSLNLYPEGRELGVDLKAALVDRVLIFKVGTKDFPLALLADFLGEDIKGRLQFSAEGRMGLNPLAFSFLDLHCSIDQFGLRDEKSSWWIKGAGAEDRPPFLFSLSVIEGKWNVKSNGLALHSPVELTVSELAGSGLLDNEGGSGSGSLLLGLRPAGQEEGIVAKGDFQAAFSRQDSWHFSLKGASETAKNTRPSLACSTFSLELKKEPAAELSIAATISGLALRQEKGRELLLPEIKVSALLPGLTLGQGGQAELMVPELTVRDGQMELRITGLAANLPLPGGEKMGTEAGKVDLARIMLNGQDLGGLLLTTEQQADGFLFVGSHTSKALEGVTVKIKGEVGSSPDSGLHGSLHLSAPRQKFSAFNLGRFLKAKEEITLGGEFGLQAGGVFSRGAQSGELLLQLDNTRLDVPKREIVVTGLNLSLALPDILQTRSLPAQPLTFATVNVGDLVFAEGKFAFQVESSSSMLLEKGSFSWCDGHVSTQGLRLSTTRNDYELNLICERLSLASLLTQFGVQGAEGDGTLNGRIPVSVVDGRLRFVDGFLSSPPGEGGTIRIGDVGVLTAGVPKDTPQFSQLDFAGEALKNFRYNWAKLRLNSEGNELLLQIKLDGQPLQPIPFRYNKQIGSFSRLEVGEAGGITHPIRLDMNLRLPFEKIMEYGGGMQKLYKMTQ